MQIFKCRWSIPTDNAEIFQNDIYVLIGHLLATWLSKKYYIGSRKHYQQRDSINLRKCIANNGTKMSENENQIANLLHRNGKQLHYRINQINRLPQIHQ